MPIPRNWSEELVSEWLSLSGYLIESNIPLSSGGPGGRNEADVVGARIKAVNTERRSLEIYHVEIGSLYKGHDENIKTLKKKFSNKQIEDVKKHFVGRLGADNFAQYQKIYVDICSNNKKVEKLEQEPEIINQDIKIWTTTTLFDEIFNTIVERREKLGNKINLPQNYWMLKLLEDFEKNYFGGLIMGSKGRKNVKKPKQAKGKGTAAPETKKK